jgi:hypothetical protein
MGIMKREFAENCPRHQDTWFTTNLATFGNISTNNQFNSKVKKGFSIKVIYFELS